MNAALFHYRAGVMRDDMIAKVEATVHVYLDIFTPHHVCDLKTTVDIIIPMTSWIITIFRRNLKIFIRGTLYI